MELTAGLTPCELKLLSISCSVINLVQNCWIGSHSPPHTPHTLSCFQEILYVLCASIQFYLGCLQIFYTIYVLVPLASIPELPAESCREIKASEGGQPVSGNYWFDSILPEKVILAHCDMETEGNTNYLIQFLFQCVKQFFHGNMNYGTKSFCCCFCFNSCFSWFWLFKWQILVWFSIQPGKVILAHRR